MLTQTWGGNVRSNTLKEILTWGGNSCRNTLEETDSGAVLCQQHTGGDSDVGQK